MGLWVGRSLRPNPDDGASLLGCHVDEVGRPHQRLAGSRVEVGVHPVHPGFRSELARPSAHKITPRFWDLLCYFHALVSADRTRRRQRIGGSAVGDLWRLSMSVFACIFDMASLS
jgi:hypothetical protein